MTQEEVLNLLKKTKKWMTIKEISKKLNSQRGSISQNLRKLYKYGEVMRKEEKVNQWGRSSVPLYKYKD